MDYSAYKTLQVEMQEGILTVKLNRPEMRNAMNQQMRRELDQIWRDIDGDPDVDAVVLSGVGNTFSVGGDAKDMQAGNIHPLNNNVFGRARRKISNLLQVEAPIIAALNGDTIGLGANLALLCDVVIADKSARIGDPHVKMGVVAGDSACVIWPLLCGVHRAKEYLMTGDLMTADEAERIGLINRVVEDGHAYEQAVLLAKRLQAGPKLAVRWTKHALNKLVQQQYNLVMDTALALEMVTILTDDHKEAVSAFLEKRKPSFKGR
jgi:enoyl-CoA hydratase